MINLPVLWREVPGSTALVVGDTLQEKPFHPDDRDDLRAAAFASHSTKTPHTGATRATGLRERLVAPRFSPAPARPRRANPSSTGRNGPA
jgi:hypothetical protein